MEWRAENENLLRIIAAPMKKRAARQENGNNSYQSGAILRRIIGSWNAPFGFR